MSTKTSTGHAPPGISHRIATAFDQQPHLLNALLAIGLTALITTVYLAVLATSDLRRRPPFEAGDPCARVTAPASCSRPPVPSPQPAPVAPQPRST